MQTETHINICGDSCFNLLLLFMLLSVSPGYAQLISGSVAIQHNSFTDYDKATISSFQPALGYSLQLGLEEIKNKNLKMSAFFHFDHYQGEFLSSAGGPMSSLGYKGSTRKWQLGIILYPFDFTAFKKLHIQLGGEIGLGIYDSNTGEYRESIGSVSTVTPFGKNSGIHAPLTGAIAARISWRIPLNQQWVLVPQSSILYGISPDMMLATKTFSIRPSFGLGFLYMKKP
jgi:hypothetical protein